LPIKAATLVFCTECSETQVATSALIDLYKFSVLFLATCSPLITSVVPKVGGEAEMGDWGMVKQKWAVGAK